jgi:hypothetical protein
VKRQLDLAGVTSVLEEEVLDAMSQAELDVMEITGDVRDITDITFDSTPPHDTGVYPLSATQHRVYYIATPSKWSQNLILTNDANVFEEKKQSNPTGTQPLVCLQINDELHFWPVPTNGDTVTVYSIAQPATPYSQVEGAGDPIVSWHWDEYLRYGALSRLLSAGNPWEDKAKKAFDREAHVHVQQSGAPLLVDHASRRLGF